MRDLQRLRCAGTSWRVKLYAAHTTGRRNRETLRRFGFGMLGSAAYRWTDPEWAALDRGGLGWALDNGAWSAHREGRAFDEDAYRRAVEEAGRLDFVVCPDVVMDADGTRRMADRWLEWTLDHANAARVLLPVQNGMESDDLPLGDRIGVFVGGDSAWKERTMSMLARRAHAVGAYCHVGRVNTAGRLEAAIRCGADSCDGSGASIYSVHAVKMASWRRGAIAQGQLFSEVRR